MAMMTNDLSFMCIEASMHVHLPAPSLSIRVWNGSPHDLLIKAAELPEPVSDFRHITMTK